MFDLQCMELKEKLLVLLNESKLPVTVLHYIFKEATDVLAQATEKAISDQKNELDKQASNDSAK